MFTYDYIKGYFKKQHCEFIYSKILEVKTLKTVKFKRF